MDFFDFRRTNNDVIHIFWNIISFIKMSQFEVVENEIKFYNIRK